MSHPFRAAAGRGGHTLLELLTVLVLILVIASLAAPSMNSYLGHTKTRRALDRVANDIALARMAAVRGGTRSSVSFSGATYTVSLLQTPTPSVIRTVYLSQEYGGVTLRSPTADGKLVFDSRGLLVSTTTGPIVITAPGSVADSALITAGGRVYREF
jgi:prepilin-type N-terminal cleavage/methylation domain-containing protein